MCIEGFKGYAGAFLRSGILLAIMPSLITQGHLTPSYNKEAPYCKQVSNFWAMDAISVALSFPLTIRLAFW